MTYLSGNTFFDGPAGRIEAILKGPEGGVAQAAIVCHPHPLFGGTMHNKVVCRIAKAFEESGFASLRFNFRGTGLSQGVHDNGHGEQDDLRAAITFIEVRYPGAEMWLAGFSFGAAVMLRLGCTHASARALVAAGIPVSRQDFSSIASCDKPKLLIQGSLDEFGSVADLRGLFDRLAEPKRLRIIEGADHFFEGKLLELEGEVTEFITSV